MRKAEMKIKAFQYHIPKVQEYRLYYIALTSGKLCCIFNSLQKMNFFDFRWINKLWNIDFFFPNLYFTAFLNLANYKSGYLPELMKRAQIVKYKQPIKSEIITRWEIEKWHDPPSASFDNLIVDVLSFSEEFQKLRLLINNMTHNLWDPII